METTYIWLLSFRGKCIQYTVVKANYNTNTANKRVMVSSSVFGSVVLHSHVVTTVRVHPTVSSNWKKSYKMKDVGEEEEKREKNEATTAVSTASGVGSKGKNEFGFLMGKRESLVEAEEETLLTP